MPRPDARNFSSHLRCLALTCAAIAVAGTAPAQEAGSTADTARAAAEVRPFVLFVHGRGQMDKPDTTLVREWLGAMKRGLARAGDSTLFGPADIGFVLYQHVFEKSKLLDAECAPGMPVNPGVAGQSIVDSAYRFAAIREDPRRSPRNVLLDFARASTNRLSQPWVQRKALKHTPDTRRWLNFHSPEYCSVQRALVRGLALARGRPVIIVAHSMGGLASYRLLVHADSITPPPGTSVVRLVTLGTQVGQEPLAQALSGRPRRPYPYPSVGRWVNIHDVDDPISWPTFDATEFLFETLPDSTPPVDVPIHVDVAYHHSISGYLSHPIVVRGIASAWCQSIRPRPDTCDRYGFQDVGAGSGPPGPPSWNAVGKRTTRFALSSGAGAVGAIAIGYIGKDPKPWSAVGWAASGALLGSFFAVAIDRVWPSL